MSRLLFYYIVFIRKRSFFALATSISGLVCATYSRTSPHNPLILTRPEGSPCGQPSLSTFVDKSFLSGQKNPRFQTGNYIEGESDVDTRKF